MKEVILLGDGDSSQECPFDAELWATAKVFPRIDPPSDCAKVFALGAKSTLKDEIEIALKNKIPIVSTEDYATERFPLDEIEAKFRYALFKPTVSYMIAYALYLGYDKMRLYGIDQGAEWHLFYDKHYVTYWLGVAKGKGVVAEITKASGLYRLMRYNVKDMYLEKEAFKESVKGKYRDFQDMIDAGLDPYCLVSGLDLDAIKVETRDKSGRLLAEWHHMT